MVRVEILHFCLKISLGNRAVTAHKQYPHGLNCRPGPCEGVAGAMSASRVVCKVVQFTVKQRQLRANICNDDAS